jgi:hypothetical protein
MICDSLTNVPGYPWFRRARLTLAVLSAVLGWLTLSPPARAVTGLTITGIEATCEAHSIKFTRTGSLQTGETFELWRTTNGQQQVKVTTVPAFSASTFTDVNFVPGTDETHTYQIRASRPGALVISNSKSIVAAKSNCGMPSVLRARVLRVSCPQGGMPLALDVNQLLFDGTSGAVSVANHLFDSSAGQTSFEGEDEGISRVLSTSAKCGESLTPSGRWIGLVPSTTRAEIKAMMEELNGDAAGKPDRWVVIIDRGINGDKGTIANGVRGIFIGGGMLFDEPLRGQRGILHELGHSYGAHHAGTLQCASTPFPKNWNVDSSCTSDPLAARGVYGDNHDPMGVGGSHYSAFNKYVFGWIPASDVVTVPLAEKKASSTDVVLRDAAWTDGPRLVKIAYGTAQGTEYFFLEYRRPLGFNAQGLLGQDFDPVSSSVYIRYFPTRALSCGVARPCVAASDNTSTWLPFSPAGGSKWLIREDQDYWDPYRKIRITMLSRSGRNTTLRIEHEAQ